MISKKYRFIYIHIPKTGGNSIQAALAPYSDDRLVFRKSMGNVVGEDGLQGLDVFNNEIGFNHPRHKHASIQDYYEKLGDEINSYFIFTSIRNPWDRVVSQTAFLSSDPLPQRKLSTEELNFPRPMVDYIARNGVVVVENFIRFESLQSDFDSICKKLGIDPPRLPHKNKSSRNNYRDYFSPASLDFVQAKFRADIDLFGYAFDQEVVDGK